MNGRIWIHPRALKCGSAERHIGDVRQSVVTGQGNREEQIADPCAVQPLGRDQDGALLGLAVQGANEDQDQRDVNGLGFGSSRCKRVL